MGEDELLFHAMALMVAADGEIAPEELVTLENYVLTVPEFAHSELGALIEASSALASRGVEASIEALSGLGEERLKLKAFVIAVDLALANGEIGINEEEMIEAMRHVLGITSQRAARIREVLALKYA